MKKQIVCLCTVFITCTANLHAQTEATPLVNFTPLITQGLNAPVDITNAGDGSNRLFIAEQGGKIKVYKNSTLLGTPFLNISSIVASTGGEQGLLSLVFHPDYENNKNFFVYYTATNGNVTIARYTCSGSDPDIADQNSGKILLSLPKKKNSLGRNGGDMHFGTDGYLYIGIGDGGSGTSTFGNPQNGKTLFGKMLRIDVNEDNEPYYSIPADNPFVNNPDIKDEIWAIGLRQPWRWSFDRQTGDMWIGDVGQGDREEINFIKPNQSAGINFGWPCYEGNQSYKPQGCGNMSSYFFPAYDYQNNSTTGGHAVIGGYVYRGSAYPSLKGYYICADYGTHNLWTLKPKGTGWKVNAQKDGAPLDVESFGEDENGELYVTSLQGVVFSLGTNVSSAAKNAEIKDLSSSVYPTIVSNSTLFLDLKSTYKSVRIVDMNGREILLKSLDGQTGKITVNLPHVSAGMYIVRLYGDQDLQQKIYIQE